jgi:Cytochrome oxidase c subunit VIb
MKLANANIVAPLTNYLLCYSSFDLVTDRLSYLHEMGFWPTFWSSTPSPKLSADGTPVAPGRSERSRCWEARDGYFRCLDRIEVLDSITDKDKAEKGCGAEGKEFDANCASSWVSYSL